MVSAGTLGGSWISMLPVGCFTNHVMPAHAILCLVLAVSELAGQVRAWAPRLESVVYALGILQLARLAYVPQPFLPDARDLAAGARLVETVAEIDGEVLLGTQSIVAHLAGKRMYAHQEAVDDALGVGDAESTRLRAEFERAFRDHLFKAIVMPSNPTPLGDRPVYRHDRAVGLREGALRPRTGFDTVPTAIFPDPG